MLRPNFALGIPSPGVPSPTDPIAIPPIVMQIIRANQMAFEWAHLVGIGLAVIWCIRTFPRSEYPTGGATVARLLIVLAAAFFA